MENNPPVDDNNSPNPSMNPDTIEPPINSQQYAQPFINQVTPVAAKKSTAPPIAAIAGLLILILGGGAIVFFSHKKSEPQTGSDNGSSAIRLLKEARGKVSSSCSGIIGYSFAYGNVSVLPESQMKEKIDNCKVAVTKLDNSITELANYGGNNKGDTPINAVLESYKNQKAPVKELPDVLFKVYKVHAAVRTLFDSDEFGSPTFTQEDLSKIVNSFVATSEFEQSVKDRLTIILPNSYSYWFNLYKSDISAIDCDAYDVDCINSTYPTDEFYDAFLSLLTDLTLPDKDEVILSANMYGGMKMESLLKRYMLDPNSVSSEELDLAQKLLNQKFTGTDEETARSEYPIHFMFIDTCDALIGENTNE